jgi:phosphoenolpyruvate-protein kinase (PTS system EI component)
MFQKLSEFDDLNRGFLNIKRQIDKNRRIVKSITNKRKHLLYEHYQVLEDRYLKDEDTQQLISENKDKAPEQYESKF